MVKVVSATMSHIFEIVLLCIPDLGCSWGDCYQNLTNQLLKLDVAKELKLDVATQLKLEVAT